MSVSVQLYQERGPLTSGRGTTHDLVQNIGWANDSGPEATLYDLNPIRRPDAGIPFAYSYKIFSYFKVIGTHTGLIRPRLTISDVADSTNLSAFVFTSQFQMFYRLTDSYSTPSSTFDGTLTKFIGPTEVIIPKLSYTSPVAGLEYRTVVPANSTVYTMLLETQLFVANNNFADSTAANNFTLPSALFAYGNVGPYSFKFEIEEFDEDGL